jgi:pimeloyl-ACP methyl ester carboxylesterase
MRPMRGICVALGFLGLLAWAYGAGESPNASKKPVPTPPGKLVNLGGHRLHVNCTGSMSPTVVVESGLGDFSFDWILVQSQVSRFTRICTYDRAGYAWSDPGPKPRTFAQINLELYDALSKLKEQGPFVLVGHSYGGPVVRNYAATYPHEVAGMVLVDASFEGQRVGMGGKATMRLGDGAKGMNIPSPHEDIMESDKPAETDRTTSQIQHTLDPMYNVLSPAERNMQLWAQSLSQTEDAENNQREWSGEYFAKWLANSQQGILKTVPLIVLTRAVGGYSDDDYDISATQMEKERKEGQAKLALLSNNSRQVIVNSGHNMELQDADDVSTAIREVVDAVRHHGKL